MSNWDDDDWEAEEVAIPRPPGPPVVANAWDDEDASESEDEKETFKKQSAPMKPSKLRALAMKEREEKEREKERERVIAREKELESLSAIQRKMRMQQIVEEADLDNARDLFMIGSSADGKEMQEPDKQTIESFTPKTEADYGKLADMVGEKCRKLNTDPKRTLRYITFLKDLMRIVVKDLGPEDVKDLSTHMGILSNEKRDQLKKAKGSKKKGPSKKSNVRVDRPGSMLDDRFDDFEADAFM